MWADSKGRGSLGKKKLDMYRLSHKDESQQREGDKVDKNMMVDENWD